MNAGARHEGTVSIEKGLKIYYFRLTAVDLAGHELRASFAVPAGRATPPPPDPAAPLAVRISGIKDGEVLPPTSQLSVSVDNLAQAVQCVLLINNKPTSVPLGCNSSRPRTINWEKHPKCALKVKVRVVDVTGRTATSPEVAVTNRAQPKR